MLWILPPLISAAASLHTCLDSELSLFMLESMGVDITYRSLKGAPLFRMLPAMHTTCKSRTVQAHTCHVGCAMCLTLSYKHYAHVCVQGNGEDGPDGAVPITPEVRAARVSELYAQLRSLARRYAAEVAEVVGQVGEGLLRGPGAPAKAAEVMEQVLHTKL